MRFHLIFLICVLILIVSLSVEGKKGKGKVSKGNAKPVKGKGSSAGKKAKGKGGKVKPAKGKGKKKPAVEKPSTGKTKPAKGKGKKKPVAKKPSTGKTKPKPTKGKGKKKPKPSKAQQELDATFKEAKDLLERLNTLEKELEEADQRINATRPQDRHIVNNANDDIAVVDATLSGYQTKCGNQVVTGWTTTGSVNTYWTAGAVLATAPFTTSTGTYTHPATAKNAWLNICAFARFRNTGNSNDVVIRKSGSIIAAFGNADRTDWRSTGTCVIELVAPGNTITVQQESGGSSDCIEETGWYYARLMINLVANLTA